MFDGMGRWIMDSFVSPFFMMIFDLLLNFINVIYKMIDFFSDFSIINNEIIKQKDMLVVISTSFLVLVIILKALFNMITPNSNQLKIVKNVAVSVVLITMFPTFITSANNVVSAVVNQVSPTADSLSVSIANITIKDKTKEQEKTFDSFEEFTDWKNEDKYIERVDTDIATSGGVVKKDDYKYDINYILAIATCIVLLLSLMLFTFKIATSYMAVSVYYVTLVIPIIVGVADDFKMFGQAGTSLLKEWGKIIFYGLQLNLFIIFLDFFTKKATTYSDFNALEIIIVNCFVVIIMSFFLLNGSEVFEKVFNVDVGMGRAGGLMTALRAPKAIASGVKGTYNAGKSTYKGVEATAKGAKGAYNGYKNMANKAGSKYNDIMAKNYSDLAKQSETKANDAKSRSSEMKEKIAKDPKSVSLGEAQKYSNFNKDSEKFSSAAVNHRAKAQSHALKSNKQKQKVNLNRVNKKTKRGEGKE